MDIQQQSGLPLLPVILVVLCGLALSVAAPVAKCQSNNLVDCARAGAASVFGDNLPVVRRH